MNQPGGQSFSMDQLPDIPRTHTRAAKVFLVLFLLGLGIWWLRYADAQSYCAGAGALLICGSSIGLLFSLMLAFSAARMTRAVRQRHTQQWQDRGVGQ